jgi:hypothetical protein
MKKPMESFVPIRWKRRQGRLLNTGPSRHDLGLLESIGRALYWESLLASGQVGSCAELAEREGLKPPNISHVLRLAQLSPKFMERCLFGEQPRTLTQRWLKRNALPSDWWAQDAILKEFD